MKICFRRQIRVAWVDTNCSGFAETSAYIRWMEETEYAFLRSRELSVSMHDKRGQYGFPRLKTELTIHSPALFDETLEVGLELAEVSPKQLEYRFCVTRLGDVVLPVGHPNEAPLPGKEPARAGSLPVAEGRFLVACCRFPVNAPPFAILIPELLLERLSSP